MMKIFYLFVSVVVFIAGLFANAAASDNFNVISKTESHLYLELNMPPLEIIPVKDSPFMVIKSDSLFAINQEGAPGVLVASVLIEIPPECEILLEPFTLKKKNYSDFILAPSPERFLNENNNGYKVADERFRVNKQLYSVDAYYPGKFAEVEFTGWLRDKRVARLKLYPVQYNPVLKTLDVYEKMKLLVKFVNSSRNTENKAADVYVSASDNSKFEKIYESCLLNCNQFSSIKTENDMGKSAYAGSLWPAEINQSPFAVKAKVTEDGIYRITYEDLNSLGIDLSSTTNENISVSNLGLEIAVYCSGSGRFKPGDYILYYGDKIKTLYAKTNIYWVYQGAEEGRRMQEVSGSLADANLLQSSFEDVLHAEEDKIYWQNIPPYTEDVDHWFWEKISIIDPPSLENITFNLNNIDLSSGSYSMKLNLRGETDTAQKPDHHTRVYVNDNLIDDFAWEGQVELTQDIDDISPYYFAEGSNTVTVEAVADTGAVVDSYYINWFEIIHNVLFAAEDDALKFFSGEKGSLAFEITGFSSSDIWGFDITDTLNVALLTNAVITENGSTHRISFGDEVSESKSYYAVSSNAFKSPSEIVADEPSDLSTERDSVDYIIITHESFYNTIQELKRHRQSMGLTVEAVRIQDVYDEFSYGLKDAKAIKSFLSHAYSNWHRTDHPTYVLLVGDASLDYRDDKGNYDQGKEDLLPTYIFQTDVIGDTPTDNWFVCVSGDDFLPDMAVGRLCVKTEYDLQSIIDKIVNYEKEDLAIWNGNVVLAADNEALFENISDNLAELLPDGYHAEKIYLSEYDDVQHATEDLIDKLSAGAVIASYSGHGHIDEWAAENLFQTPDERTGNERNDVARLTNNDRFTFLIALNCLNGFFAHWDDDYSLAEEILRAENKGAVACFAPTSTGYPSEHRVLANTIFKTFFQDGNNISGPLVTTAKIKTYGEIASRDIVETFTLFGDPATELKLLDAGSLSEFDLITPYDKEILHEWPPADFTWGEGLYEHFKVQYSVEPAFLPETTITVPVFPFLTLSSGQYTPNIFVWSILDILSARNSIIYWRVVAYDNNFNNIRKTDYRCFYIEK